MKCDIIIPVFNETVLTRNCLDSIAANTDTPYTLILIDNASGDETKKFLECVKSSYDNVKLVRNETNLGWVKAVNQGIKISDSRYVCIMNNDTVVKTRGWLAKLIDIANVSDDIGLVNPRFDIKASIVEYEPYIEIDFCRGYCILIKRAVIDKIEGLDEAYGLGYYDDDDLSIRAIRAGFRCVRSNGVVVEHLKDSTFSAIFKDEVRRELHEKNKQLFYKKWGRRLKIVFIITGSPDRQALKRTILALARRQHIVYLWNLTEPLDIKHTNIRENMHAGLFSSLVFGFTIYLNSLKKEAKRYSLVFTDDLKLGAILSRQRPGVYGVDFDKDAGRISELVANAARV